MADDREDRVNAAELAMHPLAGAAALSALGMGVASQAFSLWMGAVAGSMEAAQKMFAPMPGGTAADEASLPAYKGPASASVRARAAVETIVADAATVARDAGDVMEKTSRKVAVDMVPAKAAPKQPARQSAGKATAGGKPAAIERPASPDDLKAISGIGPKLETVLNGLGVWTYAQIAAWSPAEIAWLDDHLGFNGRIGRDGWIAQAAELAKTRD